MQIPLPWKDVAHSGWLGTSARQPSPARVLGDIIHRKLQRPLTQLPLKNPRRLLNPDTLNVRTAGTILSTRVGSVFIRAPEV